MTKLLSAVSVLALCATPVLAADTAEDPVENVATETSEAVEAGENSLENAAEETGNAISDAASNAADATENAADSAGEMATDAAEATGNAAAAAGAEIEQGAENMAQGAENMAQDAEAELDEAEADMAETEDGMADEGMTPEATAGTAMSTVDDDDNLMSADEIVLTSTFRASDLMGNNIYALQSDNAERWGVEGQVDDIAASYDNIGSIDDLLIDDQGKLVGVLAEVGGFLGIGDKLVVLGLDEIRVAVSGGDPYYVTRATSEELENREEVDDDIWED